MKRFALAALAVVTLLGLTGCDLLGSTNDKPATGGTTDIFSGTGKDGGTSQWWIKGSFDGWKGVGDQDAIKSTDTIHYLSVDSLNPKLLSYTIEVPAPGLRQNDYEFVLMNDGAAGSRVKFDYLYDTTTTKFADNAVYSLSASATGHANAKFTATATTYVVKVDITNPAAPRVKLVPGTTAATAYTEKELADGLNLKGSVFDGSWTAHTTASEAVTGTKDGIYDAATHTVTFAGLKAIVQTGEFGVDSLAGWMTVPNIVASAAAPVTATFVSGGTNPKFTPVANSDAVYTFVITIDAAKTVAQGRYTLSVTVTSAGTTAWPDPIDTTIATTVMTNGTGAGSSWGAQLGTISTAVSGGRLYVKVTFAKTDVSGKNLWLFLDNADVTTGNADFSADGFAGYGDLKLANTAGINVDFAVTGWGSGQTGGNFHQGNFRSIANGAQTTAVGATYEDTATGTVWYRIPVTALGLDATHNHLKAVVLWGDNSSLHSAIPAMTADNPVSDITAVATATLSGL